MAITSQVERLLAEWAAMPTTPVTELSTEKVRADDQAILDLQRPPLRRSRSRTSTSPADS